MITSANWTARFLDASVFMKVNDGQRRLYVTTTEAYLQARDSERSWSKMKAMPKADETVGLDTLLANDVAIESCWRYNEQLDRLPSLNSSFASHESQWSTRSQVDGRDNVDIQQRPLSPRSEARPPPQRTISLSSSAPALSLSSSAPALSHIKEIIRDFRHRRGLRRGVRWRRHHRETTSHLPFT